MFAVIAPRPLRSPLDWLTKRLASGFSRFPHAASQPRGRFMWSGRDTYLSAACKTTYHTVDCLITPDFSAGRKGTYLNGRKGTYLDERSSLGYVTFSAGRKGTYLNDRKGTDINSRSSLNYPPFCRQKMYVSKWAITSSRDLTALIRQSTV